MKRFVSLLLLVVLLVSMIPLSASASSTMYVKTANGLSLNVRSSRTTHANNVVATLSYGTKVTVLRSYSTGWKYIKWGTGAKNRGYVISSALSSKKPSNYVSKTKYIYNNTGSTVNIRSTMKSHANNIVVSLKIGTKVTVLDTYSGGWSKIKYKTYTGYVQNRYLKNKLVY